MAGKKYTLELMDRRGSADDPNPFFVVVSLTNTLAFAVGQTLTEQEVVEIMEDPYSKIKVR